MLVGIVGRILVVAVAVATGFSAAGLPQPSRRFGRTSLPKTSIHSGWFRPDVMQVDLVEPEVDVVLDVLDVAVEVGS